MKYMRKLHPYLDILVSNIGEVFVPQNYHSPAHWTLGCQYNNGYMAVMIARKTYLVHRLVLEAFVGPCPKGFECNHKNRDRSDNRLENLEWTTRSENNRNTSSHDRVEAQGRTHYYEDARKANREQKALYRQSKRKTHRSIQFADGSHHWVSLPEADAYLIIPLKQRTFKH